MALVVASLAMAGAAIALLAVYGADVAAGYGSETGEGFIPFDHKTRGMGLGLPALILPIAAYFVSRKEPSRALGAMIVAAGILIIAGGAVVIGNADPADAEESGRNVLAEAVPLIAAGLFQVGLGAVKLRRS